MLRQSKYAAAFAALLSTALCAQLAGRAGEDILPGLEGIPKIVAEVDGKPIYRTELIRELVGSSGTKALERLIQRELVEQAAREQHVTVTPADIEQQFAVDRRELADNFIRMFRNQNQEVPIEEIVRARFGMSLDEYKNVVIRQRLLARRCLAADLPVSDDDLRKHFESNRDRFQQPVRFRAAHILLTPLNPRDLFAAGGQAAHQFDQKNTYTSMMNRKFNEWKDQGVSVKQEGVDEEVDTEWRKFGAMAERVLQDLLASPNRWNDYVAKFSQDPMDKARREKGGTVQPSQRAKAGYSPGDLGWFTKFGPMVPAFYQGAKDIPKGQIGAQPVRTEFGYHLIKMIDIIRPPIVSFEECKDKVRRDYIDEEIDLRSPSWFDHLAQRADLKTEKATLWPPREERASVSLDPQTASAVAEDRDPIVGRINATELRRSEVWKELLRSEGEDALRRLVNREVVLDILKVEGLQRMEWMCANPATRPQMAPPRESIQVPEELLQRELNDDRLDYDKLLAQKEFANLNFSEYVYRRFGQTEAEYRRALEAGLILKEVVKRKVIPRGKKDLERTLRLEFALAKDQYSEKEWYEISHILIVPSGGMFRSSNADMLAARMTADNLYRQCMQNPDIFPELVDKFSDDTAENKAAHGFLGGCYSDRTPDMLPESKFFYSSIQSMHLEPGQFCPVVRSVRGFHVLRLDHKHLAREATYEEKRSQIEKDFLNEQARYYADIWVRALNSRAIVKHYLYKPTLSFDEPDVDSLPKDDTFKVPKE